MTPNDTPKTEEKIISVPTFRYGPPKNVRDAVIGMIQPLLNELYFLDFRLECIQKYDHIPDRLTASHIAEAHGRATSIHGIASSLVSMFRENSFPSCVDCGDFGVELCDGLCQGCWQGQRGDE